MSKVYSLKMIQKIPVPPEQAWGFFSSPDNLLAITPENLRFKVISKHHGEKMYPGQIIEYKVSPLLGIPLYWMTEITQVEENNFFIDEQRHGPFSLWHHQHIFKMIDRGVEITDIVHYKLPLWFLGDIAHSLFVKKQVEKIFEYRRVKVEELFGKFAN